MTRGDAPDLVPGDFFVLRTPLLPFDVMDRWSEGLEAGACAGEAGDGGRLASAVERDRRRLRRRLEALLAQPEVHEALLVASSSLLEGVEPWRKDPESKKGRRFEEALVRYVQRMSTRATPFGLFSGCTVGTVGAETVLTLADRASYRRHTRLDSSYLGQLCDDLNRSPELRRSLRYRVNSSLYRIGDRIRYAEARLRDGARSHHLVALDGDPYLERALDLGRNGTTVEELARALAGLDLEAGVTLEEATEFVDELLDGQVLVPDLAPSVTGDAPIDELIEQLRAVAGGGPASQVLAAVRTRLAELDGRPLGSDLEAYGAVASALEALPPRVEPSRLLQVDLMKPGTAVLGADALAEIERGIRMLHRVATGYRNEELEAFRRAFLDRYETGEEVPLAEVLDDELGPGLGGPDGHGDPSPLLDGMAIPEGAGAEGPPAQARGALRDLLLRKLESALRDGALEIEVSDEDVEPLPPPALPLADAFLVKAAVAANPEEGPAEIALHSVSGPSGAQMLGRFCYADAALEEGVRRHLGREEALDPEAVFAEIVHLPEGRLGNILLRPVLRDHELPFLGRGGAREEHRIPVTDLMVSVAGDRIVLRSRRLGRRIVPRLTSAHNYRQRSLSVYRFLCLMQWQDVCPGLTWSWGAFAGLSFLPRVRCGRVVVSRARWRVRREEIEGVHDTDPARRVAAARRWREARRVPSRVLLADGDNELLVDFENSLSLDAFAAAVRKRSGFELVELFPAPESLRAVGPEGRFLHEVLVPFTRRTPALPRPAVPRPTAAVRRSFEPGSEWLYAKLYTGTATADRVLTHTVRPLAREALAAGTVDRWFFIRFRDPHPHLRLRFQGHPEVLLHELLPALRDATAPLLESGLAWRLQLQEYRREVERYGGPAGIGLAERLFHLDSEAVVEVLRSLPEEGADDARWKLALLGTDRLLADLGFEGDARLALLAEAKGHWAEEFRVAESAALRQRLADRLRREREALRAMVFSTLPPDDPLAAGAAAIRRRSQAVGPVVQELRARERAQTLGSPVSAIAHSLVHMFNNRLFRSRGRAHEMVLSDFLERLHRSEAARHRARRPAARRAS